MERAIAADAGDFTLENAELGRIDALVGALTSATHRC
jgi:hypothetical protein